VINIFVFRAGEAGCGGGEVMPEPSRIGLEAPTSSKPAENLAL
jgi:hypothetical protein